MDGAISYSRLHRWFPRHSTSQTVPNSPHWDCWLFGYHRLLADRNHHTTTNVANCACEVAWLLHCQPLASQCCHSWTSCVWKNSYSAACLCARWHRANVWTRSWPCVVRVVRQRTRPRRAVAYFSLRLATTTMTIGSGSIRTGFVVCCAYARAPGVVLTPSASPQTRYHCFPCFLCRIDFQPIKISFKSQMSE